MKSFLAALLLLVHARAAAGPVPSEAPRLLDGNAEASAPPAPNVLFFGPERIFPKDPHAALCFSLLFPGLGHLYDQSYTRGLVVLGIFGAGAAVLANNAKLVPDPSDLGQPTRIRNLTGVQVTAPLLLAWYLLSAQDARAQARKYNKRLGFRFAVQARGPSVDFRF